MSEARIEVVDLVVRYGNVAAVDGVSFTVGRGEHVTLLGPSGCGKTTTLRAIAGLEEPSSGAIWIDGRGVYSSAERRNIPSEKRGVSMVFQSYAIWPHMTVFDNFAYGLRVRKLARTEVALQVDPNCANCSGGSTSPRSMSRTTRRRHWRSPTGSSS
jgi:ABC-type Fe3+/spermidine/putrescine transport system ATPase subunit